MIPGLFCVSMIDLNASTREKIEVSGGRSKLACTTLGGASRCNGLPESGNVD